MAIKHAFTSAKADGPDSTQVQPTNWNADHTIDDGTLAPAKLASQAAGTYVGRATGAGAGVPSALTGTQATAGLDVVTAVAKGLVPATGGGTSTFFRADASFAAPRLEPATNLSADNGDMVIAENGSPVAPAGGVKWITTKFGGRVMPAFITAAGMVNPLQPNLGAKQIVWWQPNPGAASNGTSIGGTITVAGSGAARTPASTNLFTSQRRVGFTSTTIAGLRFNVAMFWRGNAAGLGGGHVVFRWGWSDAVLVTTGRGFAGLGSSGAPTDVDPSGLLNVFGVGCDNGDANLQLIVNDGSTRPKTDLGANFPAQTVSTDLYELGLFWAPNASAIDYKLTRLNTGHVSANTISTNLFSSTTFLAMTMWRGAGGSGNTVGIDGVTMYGEGF